MTQLDGFPINIRRLLSRKYRDRTTSLIHLQNVQSPTCLQPNFQITSRHSDKVCKGLLWLFKVSRLLTFGRGSMSHVSLHSPCYTTHKVRM